MVATWDDADWIASELDRLAVRADRQGLGDVQLAYRTVLLARAEEIASPNAVPGHELGPGSTAQPMTGPV